MHHLITNKITALFIGQLDLWTGKWFPFKKMTWEEKKGTNYLNLSVTFLEEAKAFRTLYPKSEKVISYGRVMNYRDIHYSAIGEIECPSPDLWKINIKNSMGLT